jgi:hypothetical protein
MRLGAIGTIGPNTHQRASYAMAPTGGAAGGEGDRGRCDRGKREVRLFSQVHPPTTRWQRGRDNDATCNRTNHCGTGTYAMLQAGYNIRHDVRGGWIILFVAPGKGSRRKFNFRMLDRIALRHANVSQCRALPDLHLRRPCGPWRNRASYADLKSCDNVCCRYHLILRFRGRTDTCVRFGRHGSTGLARLP